MIMAKYSEEFAKKDFTADTIKAAYMLAVKWYATNILSKGEINDVQVEFEKHKDLPIVTIRLFAVLDEIEIRKQHCKCCEEMHHTFFINENNNCNVCTAAGYQNRIDQKMKIKKDYYKSLLKKQEEV